MSGSWRNTVLLLLFSIWQKIISAQNPAPLTAPLLSPPTNTKQWHKKSTLPTQISKGTWQNNRPGWKNGANVTLSSKKINFIFANRKVSTLMEQSTSNNVWRSNQPKRKQGNGKSLGISSWLVACSGWVGGVETSNRLPRLSKIIPSFCQKPLSFVGSPCHWHIFALLSHSPPPPGSSICHHAPTTTDIVLKLPHRTKCFSCMQTTKNKKMNGLVRLGGPLSNIPVPTDPPGTTNPAVTIPTVKPSKIVE